MENTVRLLVVKLETHDQSPVQRYISPLTALHPATHWQLLPGLLLTIFKGTPRRTRDATGEEAIPAEASTEDTSEATAKPRRQRAQRKPADGGVSEEADASGDAKK